LTEENGMAGEGACSFGRARVPDSSLVQARRGSLVIPQALGMRLWIAIDEQAIHDLSGRFILIKINM